MHEKINEDREKVSRKMIMKRRNSGDEEGK